MTGSDTVSYAVIVYVADPKDPKVLGVVGPIEDWPLFFAKVHVTYTMHCPGDAYCNNPDAGTPCPPVGRIPPGQTPFPPPVPPPPMGGYAISYQTQSTPVDPNDPNLSGGAAGAAAAAVTALGQ